MGQNQKHALGRNLQFFTSEESTYGTFVQAAAADAVKTLTTSMEFSQERVDRADARSTRSTQERITRRIEATWSAETYVVPSGAAGTAPDCRTLIKSAMGAETINGGTSAVYSLTDTQAMTSMTLLRESSEVLSQRMNGCYTEEMTISGSGGEEPRISFSGTGINVVNTGTSTATNAGSSTTGPCNVTASEGENFAANSLVQFSGGTIAEVASVSGDVLTFSATESWSSSETIKPFVPASPTTAGNPINGITGSITLAGNSDLPITAFEITLTNNIKLINDEAFTDKGTDFVPGFRNVTGSLTVRARKDQIIELNKRKSFGTRDIAIVLGATAGNILTIDMNQVEFGFSPVEIPEAEEATFTLPFTALGTTAGADELTLTFT